MSDEISLVNQNPRSMNERGRELAKKLRKSSNSDTREDGALVDMLVERGVIAQRHINRIFESIIDFGESGRGINFDALKKELLDLRSSFDE